MKRDYLIGVIREIVPEVTQTEYRQLLDLSTAHASLQIDIGKQDPFDNMSIHVYGGDSALAIVAELLKRLNLSAAATTDTGIFDMEAATDSYKDWQTYRNQVLGVNPSK